MSVRLVRTLLDIRVPPQVVWTSSRHQWYAGAAKSGRGFFFFLATRSRCATSPGVARPGREWPPSPSRHALSGSPTEIVVAGIPGSNDILVGCAEHGKK